MATKTTVLEKNESLVQFLKFAAVGVSNTAVDWIVYGVITKFIVTATNFESTAKAISFLVAMLNSYLWNTIWTFKKEYGDSTKGGDNNAKGKIFAKFAVVSLIGWGINLATFDFVRFHMNQGQIVSLVAASAAATLLNFFMNKLWTYKK